MSTFLDVLADLPRVRLAHLPTPIQPLPNLSAQLGGPSLLVKRDDLTGLATGGNKTRKLEFLMADAVQQEADCVITAGGPQSNHCRQTAAAAAILQLDCRLVLGGDPRPLSGNLLLDNLLGAEIHWTKPSLRNETMAELARDLEEQGRRPYVIPVGGSNGIGTIGYVAAMVELRQQLRDLDLSIDRIVFATSSGGTQAGLALGAKLVGFQGRLTAISIDQLPDEQASGFRAEVCQAANDAAERLQVPERVTPDELDINYDYLGDGYGVVGDLERNAIRQVARQEGLLIGPVYTGRAMGALVDLLQKNALAEEQSVLFWHTGDESALHAYVADLG